MVECRRIIFSGRVQGVGFRMTAVEFSEGMRLSGTVRNLPDRRVEMVAEGEMEEIDGLVKRLREHFGALVRSVEQNSVPVKGLSGGIRVTH